MHLLRDLFLFGWMWVIDLSLYFEIEPTLSLESLSFFMWNILTVSKKNCQHWKQSNHQSPLCWWYRWLSRRRRRTGKISWASWQSLHGLWHGDQCREDQAYDKQHRWHQHRDQSKRTEAWDHQMIQVLKLSYNWWGSKPEILSRIAQTTAVLTGLKPVWNDKVFLAIPRYDCCAPLSHPSPCVFVDHGPSQQSSKEE